MERKIYLSCPQAFDIPVFGGQGKRVALDMSENMEYSYTMVQTLMEKARSQCRSDAYTEKYGEIPLFAHESRPCSETVIWLEMIFPNSSKG